MNLNPIVPRHHLELGFAYWTQTTKLHLSMTQLPFNVPQTQTQKLREKNPLEFVIMIDSCVEETGSLFQNFHGCFFDLLPFCLIYLNNLHSFDI